MEYHRKRCSCIGNIITPMCKSKKQAAGIQNQKPRSTKSNASPSESGRLVPKRRLVRSNSQEDDNGYPTSNECNEFSSNEKTSATPLNDDTTRNQPCGVHTNKALRASFFLGAPLHHRSVTIQGENQTKRSRKREEV